jgi:environmental stress-induced protein Ves
MRPVLRRARDLVAVPWRNGQGMTRDVATQLGPDGALLWQVSIAELVRDTSFSDYAGYDRIFTPVRGEGIALSLDGGAFLPCPLLAPFAFRGEASVECRLGGSPGRAFNVIAARGRCQAQVQVLRLAVGERIEPPAEGAGLLHCWSGALAVEEAEVQAGDTLIGAAAVAAAPSVVIQVHVLETSRSSASQG